MHISGLDSVNHIAINPSFPKCILVGSNGSHLYQCDLRHLQVRAQSCMSPSLDYMPLELPFDNRLSNDKWHFIKIYSNQEHHPEMPDSLVIAANSSRIVILCFDMKENRFKPIRALDTATPVSSVLFTKHTALVSSDKFFEIDLKSFAAEEFLDLSDSSISLSRYSKPMAAFKINKQEFLLCFKNYGLFTDEFGCRSRIDDIKWPYPPTGFLYRDPVLFICSDSLVHVIRIAKSDSSHNQPADGAPDNVPQAFVSIDEPKIVGESGKLGAFVLTKSNATSSDVVLIEGVKALKSIFTNSMETLLSSMSSIPQGINHGISTDTISTINN